MFTGLSALCSSCVGSGIMGCDWLAQLGVGRRWVGRYNSEICQSTGPLFKGRGPTPSRPSRPELATSSAHPVTPTPNCANQSHPKMPKVTLDMQGVVGHSLDSACRESLDTALTLRVGSRWTQTAKSRFMHEVKVGSPWLNPRNPPGRALGHQECPPEFAL